MNVMMAVLNKKIEQYCDANFKQSYYKYLIRIITIVSENVDYEFIPTRQGNRLLMLNGYTYSQNLRAPRNYYCSKKNVGCKAKVKFGSNGKIRSAHLIHSHEQPKYMITKSGEYFKL